MDEKILKAFDIISDMVNESLNLQTFKRESTKKDEKVISVDFKSSSIVYRIIYNTGDELFVLSGAEIVEDENGTDTYDEWKTKSKWLFDPSNNDIKDAKDIGKDFCSTIDSENKKKSKKTTKKRKKVSSGADPIFLMNRFANIMPELKDKIQTEHEEYESFRSVTFTKEKVLPLIDKLLKNGNDAKIKKFCTVLSDAYAGDNLDTQGIITYVILNSIQDENILEKVKQYLSPELALAMKHSRKLIGKKIQPEKPKKAKSSFMADTLQNM